MRKFKSLEKLLSYVKNYDFSEACNVVVNDPNMILPDDINDIYRLFYRASKATQSRLTDYFNECDDYLTVTESEVIKALNTIFNECARSELQKLRDAFNSTY